MRELTFLGFLKTYVQSLSLNNTYNIRKLAEEAATSNPRLREPLLLYSLFSEKQERLRLVSQQVGLDVFYGELLFKYDQETMVAALQTEGNMPVGYEKVWHSYQSQKQRQITDDHTKELIRKKARSLQEHYNITNYRIYTDLNLNPGNLNAWLKHGNCGKVSLDVARKVLQYLKACENSALFSKS